MRHLVWTLKRGVIDPPERVDVDTEDDICVAAYETARQERDEPMSDAEMWREQGRAVGYINPSIRRRDAYRKKFALTKGQTRSLGRAKLVALYACQSDEGRRLLLGVSRNRNTAAAKAAEPVTEAA